MTLVSIQPPHYGTVTRIIKSNTVTTGHDDMSHTFTPTVPLTAEEAVQCQNNLGHRRNLSHKHDLLTFNP